jgi:hypothetical protein
VSKPYSYDGMESQITKDITYVSKPYPFMKSNMENAGNHVQARGLPYLETSTE